MTDLYDRHAPLYDIAFDWDVGEEVAWLLDRLEPAGAPLLEPGCGSGRMLVALARRGVESVGIDRSPAMVALARSRLAAFPGMHSVEEADMVDFELGQRFGGALCPINTLCHLRPDQLVRHLDCVARQLAPGAGYLVQIGVHDPGRAETTPSVWEAERAGTRLRIEWRVVDVDLARGRERQRSRIEVVAGDGAGEVIEEDHVMTAWTPATLGDAIASSQLTRVAAYDGDLAGRPAVDPERAVGGLVWHELRASPRAAPAAGSASRPA
jgi:SAM-dependent methyltransferase